MNNQRNMILAVVLSMLVVLSWTLLQERYAPAPSVPLATQTRAALPSATAVATKLRDRKSVLGDAPRVEIATPTLVGSINLKGAQFDDLVLTHYRQSLDKTSPPVVLYSPAGSTDAALARFGWTGQGVVLPDATTAWQADQARLTPTSPVMLTWDNQHGQVFRQKISIDKDYMVSVQQDVTNKSAAPVALATYGFVSRSLPAIDKASVAHIGPIGTFDGKVNYDVDYANLDGQESGFFARTFGTTAKPGENEFPSKGGWLGFGDKYWLSAVIPAQNEQITGGFRKDNEEYRAGYAGSPRIVAPRAMLASTVHLFAGAKEVNVLDGYEASLNIPHFGKAIDWGWFEIICKPLFHLIDWLFKLTGNFGVAIILSTFVIRGLMFPIAQRQFSSMAAMRVAQPKIKALQERYKNDKQALSQETMKLYQSEKINPLGGCLPILLPIPVFFALYKVLSVSIEMRQQPFALWIHDLSAPDPVLFGLAPGIAALLPAFLAIGVLPIILGFTLWMLQKNSPMTMDPAQQQMMKFMPWIMMFFFASLAAGLQLYYIISNTLTILQQRWFFSRHPVLREPVAAPFAK